jgi:sarcosine oxidase subunit gamma
MSDTAIKTARPGLSLRLPDAPAILHVLTSFSERDGVTKELEKLAERSRFSLRAAGPGKWLALAAASEAGLLAEELRKTLGDRASLLNQSDGRVLIELAGGAAREALAKGTGVDLDPSVFPIGHSTTTAFGHVSVHLTRAAADVYELIVMRSYAHTLWETLGEAAREFGCDAPAELPEDG